MTRVIQQSVLFPVPPEELFEMYLDSKKHSEATGGRARMSRKAGGEFTGLGRPAPRTQSTDRSEPHDRANVARNSLETRRSRLDLDTAFQQGAGRGADRPRPRKCPAPRSQRRIARLAEILLEAMEEIPHDEIQARCSGTILAKWMNFRRQFEEALAFIFCRGSRR
jgi:hypothetical protein